MTHRTQTGLWAAVAALGLLATPVLGQGVRADYTQTPGIASRELNTDVQTINPNAEGNLPGDRTDMSTDDAQGGVYQSPAYRDGDRSWGGATGVRDPDTVSDYQVSPNDLVMGSDGLNIRTTQGTVGSGNGTTINRTDRETQMQRNREQRGERHATTTRGSRRGSADRDDRTYRDRAAGGTRTGTGTQGSAITPWVTNPGRGITPPGTEVPATTPPGTTTPGTTTPGATAPGSVTTPGTTTPGATAPGTTTPGTTTPGTTTPGTTTPGTTTPGASPGMGGTAGGSAGGMGGTTGGSAGGMGGTTGGSAAGGAGGAAGGGGGGGGR